MRTLAFVISFFLSSSLYPMTEGDESSSETSEEHIMIPGAVMMVVDEQSDDSIKSIDLSQVPLKELLRETMSRLDPLDKRTHPEQKTHEPRKPREALCLCTGSGKTRIILLAGLSTVGADAISYILTGELIPAFIIIGTTSLAALYTVLKYYNVSDRIRDFFCRKSQTTNQNYSDGKIMDI